MEVVNQIHRPESLPSQSRNFPFLTNHRNLLHCLKQTATGLEHDSNCRRVQFLLNLLNCFTFQNKRDISLFLCHCSVGKVWFREPELVPLQLQNWESTRKEKEDQNVNIRMRIKLDNIHCLRYNWHGRCCKPYTCLDTPIMIYNTLIQRTQVQKIL